jgi:hypothetical protein
MGLNTLTPYIDVTCTVSVMIRNFRDQLIVVVIFELGTDVLSEGSIIAKA